MDREELEMRRVFAEIQRRGREILEKNGHDIRLSCVDGRDGLEKPPCQFHEAHRTKHAARQLNRLSTADMVDRL